MQKQYSNRYLIEVNCGFQFPNETVNKWDSTYFGQYYDKIKELGFTEKEERKGIQINFLPNKNSPIAFSNSTTEDQVIFKNIQTGRAVLLGKGKISFHILKGYTNWDEFVNNFIKPFLNYYTELGLGNGHRECSIVYLNRFEKPSPFQITEYFNIFSGINGSFKEVNTNAQRIFDNGDNFLITKLNSQLLPNNSFIVNLECGATCKNLDYKKQDWETQANNTHKPIKDFFESLITEKLRLEL